MLRKSLLVILIILAVTSSSFATHIVGGEIELEHDESFFYFLRVVLYYDQANSTTALPDEIQLDAFQEKDNAFVSSFIIERTGFTRIQYSDPDCADASLQTTRHRFVKRVFLDPAIFKDPEGYYFTWAVCCRNGGIVNIEAPDSAAQTFYMEFPPVVKNGQPFVNSSPTLFEPLRDYACVGQPFYTPFSGIDPDGDSLVYKMAVPLNGSTASVRDPLPAFPSPKPIIPVKLLDGFEVDSLVKGSPPLAIDNDGLLTVTPEQVGLHVFAVICEEYRDGIKIGAVQREFQMLVINCVVPNPPKIIRATLSNGDSFQLGDTIRYQADEMPCLSLTIRDVVDIAVPIIRPKIRPLNFTEELFEFTPNPIGIPPGTGDTVVTRLCFKGTCANQEDTSGIYAMELIINDNSCPLPQADTAYFYVEVLPKPNDPPVIEIDLPYDIDSGYYCAELNFGDALVVPIKGYDANMDSIRLEGLFNGSTVSLLDGAVLPTVSGQGDTLWTTLNWDPACDAIGLGVDEAYYDFTVILSDWDDCGVLIHTEVETIRVKLKYNMPSDNAPEATVLNLASLGSNMYGDTLFLGDTIQFVLQGIDIDFDSLSWEALGIGFDLLAYQMDFTEVGGFPSLNADFSWVVPCNPDLFGSIPTDFQIEFILKDYRDCVAIKSDTIQVKLHVIPEVPLKKLPVLGVVPLQYNTISQHYEAKVQTGDMLRFDAMANASGSGILLSGEGVSFSKSLVGIDFPSAVGEDSVGSRFTWMPGCEVLGSDTGSKIFPFQLIAESEDTCSNIVNYDTLTVDIEVCYRALPNQIPVASTSISTDSVICDTVYLGEQISFDVLGADADGHFLRLEAFPQGFNLSDYDISFPSIEGVGSIQQAFSFTADCDLNQYPNPSVQQEELVVDFVVQDSSDCFIKTSDTVTLKLVFIKSLSPNNVPTLTTNLSNFNASIMTYQVSVTAGQTLIFDLLGEDQDLLDVLTLNTTGDGFNLSDLGMQVNAPSGVSPLQGQFTWQADCQYLGENGVEKTYTVIFSLRDETKDCQAFDRDEIRVEITISDVEQVDFTPINAFSPNGDDINEEFYLDNLPLDDCKDRFESITIINRWGQEVFRSTDRQFRWDGANATSGVYFYHIKFANSNYKGTVHVFK